MDECLGLPQLGYGEFSEWMHKKVANQRTPISGSFELTSRCNLRCQHCYIPLAERALKNEKELDLVEIKRILDQVTDAGCLWLLLTGGDPLIRKDFLDIYAYARRKGLILTLFTNGTLITQRIANYLADWRPFKIEITLYGATQETYEKVTGIPGSYARCMQGIELLLARKLPLALKTMLMSLNQHELSQMQAMAEGFGVFFRYDPIINPALDGSHRPNHFRLLPEQIIAFEKSDPKRTEIWNKEFSKGKHISTSDRSMYLCGAGKHVFHIDAAGKLYPCITDRQLGYNLRQGTFKEGWDQFLPQVINRQYSPDFACLGCELRPVCGQCSAAAELEHGMREQPVDFLCKLARLRREAYASHSEV